MSQTIDLELKKAFPNYLVFIKYREHQKENPKMKIKTVQR